MDIVREIVREVIDDLLNEGRFDWVSGKIVNDIWKLIRDSKVSRKKEEGYLFKYKTPINMKLYVFVKRTIDKEGGFYRIGGETLLSTKTVRMEVDIDAPNREIERLMYVDINAELNRVVRYEIEHLTQQKGKNYIPGRAKPLSIRKRVELEDKYGYFVSRDEIPAMIAGFYREAKIKKIPIDDVASSYLNYFMEENPIINQEEKGKIMKIWMDYAHKHYPAAIFSKEW